MGAIRLIAMGLIFVVAIGGAYCLGRGYGRASHSQPDVAASSSSFLSRMTSAVTALSEKPVPLEELKKDLIAAGDNDDPNSRDLAIGKLVLSLDADKAKRLLLELSGNYDEKSARLKTELLKRWAHLDPKEALAYVEKLPNTRLGNEMKGIVIQTWAEQEPETSLEYVSKLDGYTRWGGSSRDGAVSSAMISLALKDPDKAFQWAKDHLANPKYQEMTSEAFAILVDIDPVRAGAIAQQLPGGQPYMNPRERAIDTIASSWASKDRDAAMSWASSLSSLTDRNKALNSVITTWGFDDPPAAAAYAAKNLTADSRRNVFQALFSSWAMNDFQAVTDWIKQESNPKVRAEANTSVVQGLSYASVKKAADYLLTLEPGEEQNSAVWSVSYQMAEEDLNDALDWLHKLPAGAQRNATQNVVREWAQEDPKAALDYALTHETGELQTAMISAVANQWGNRDPQEALTYARSLPAGDKRDQMIKNMISSWASQDPKAASAVVSAMPDSDKERANLAASVARNWGQNNIAEAAGWVSGLSEGKARQQAMNALTQQWADFDTAKATSWLSSQPVSDSRDSVISSYLPRIMRDEPEKAVQLAMSISNSSKRLDSVQGSVREWMQSNSTAATAWVNASDLPPETKDALLKKK